MGSADFSDFSVFLVYPEKTPIHTSSEGSCQELRLGLGEGHLQEVGVCIGEGNSQEVRVCLGHGGAEELRLGLAYSN